MLGEIAPRTFENTPEAWHAAFPVPQVDGHKYARGHAVVVSGDIAATGAARMSARGALRAGAGLVTLATPRDALAVNASALTAVMVHAADTVVEFAELLGDKRLNACVIGPGAGVGERTCDFVLTALTARRHLVLDADALTSFAGAPDRLFEAIKASSDPQIVLTPHEGEFPRLFSDISNKHPGRSKLERVRAAAERSGAVVLLKGPDTVVASPDGRATIAANAPPWLATAGAGDVLAGMIAGMLAQGVPAFEAASIGVWMHGEAAREAGPGLIAEDLSETLPAVFRRLYDGFGDRLLSRYAHSTLNQRRPAWRGPIGGGGFHQPAAGILGRERDRAGSGPARSPAYPAKTASSRRRADPAAGNDGRGGGRRSWSPPGFSGSAPRCGRPWRGTRAASMA